MPILPDMYPCKPDIFEATYSPAALAAGQATAAQQSGAKLNYSVLYVYANQHGIDYNSLCVAVREASAQPAAQQGVAYAALPEPDIAVGNDGRARIYTRKDIVGEPYYTAGQLRAFADATHTLRASHGQAPAQPDPAYSAACHLATALFKKYFAHLPDFASGQAVWSLCGSTAGVISQIDNMVSGLVQPPTTAFSEDEL